MLNWVLFSSNTTEYNIGGILCDEDAIAYTYPTLFAEINVCENNYFSQSPNDRSATIIHEMMHLYWARADLAYEWDTQKFYELTEFQSKWNADSYSAFIKELCP